MGVLTTGLSSYHIYRIPTTIGRDLWKEKGLKLLNENAKWMELSQKHLSLEHQENDEVSNGIRKINNLNLKRTDEHNNPKISEELKEKYKNLWGTELSKVNEENKKLMCV